MTELRKDTELESAIQKIETLCDSSSQRMAHRFGYDDQDTKQITLALRIVRKIQSRYYPVKTRSLLRQIDSVDKNGDYKPHPSKQNWKKYKRGQDIKKGKQAVLVWKLSQEMTDD